MERNQKEVIFPNTVFADDEEILDGMVTNIIGTKNKLRTAQGIGDDDLKLDIDPPPSGQINSELLGRICSEYNEQIKHRPDSLN